MKNPHPTLGRRVLYRLDAIDLRRLRALDDRWRDPTHGGYPPTAPPSVGETYSATIVAVHDELRVALKVHIDGPHDLWVPECTCGAEPGEWLPRPVARRAALEL